LQDCATKSKGNRVYFEASFVKLVYAIAVQLIAYCTAVVAGAGLGPNGRRVARLASPRGQRHCAERDRVSPASTRTSGDFSYAIAFHGFDDPEIPFDILIGALLLQARDRGTAPPANDVVGGHAPMMIDAISNAAPSSSRLLTSNQSETSLPRGRDCSKHCQIFVRGRNIRGGSRRPATSG
jgi:hypothetical protein